MNARINEAVLTKVVAMKTLSYPQFYECAEFQMINLFESVFGKGKNEVVVNTKNEVMYMGEIKNMLIQLSQKLNHKLDGGILDCLTNHFFMHSLVPAGEDNVVMRDYFSPVIMNHFNFFLYLSEYLNTYKKMLFIRGKEELRNHLLSVGNCTNALVFHSIDQDSLIEIVDKLIADQGDCIEYSCDINKTKQTLIKFQDQDCKKNFNRDYFCKSSEYVSLMMNRSATALDWIEAKIIEDRVPVKSVDYLTIRYYMYRFLEDSFFKLDINIRSGVAHHIRCITHSIIADSVTYNKGLMKTVMPEICYSSIKARDLPFWIESRNGSEDWIEGYKTRKSNVFNDLLLIKTVELNYIRSTFWDSKTLQRTFKHVREFSLLPKNERDKLKAKVMSEALYNTIK